MKRQATGDDGIRQRHVRGDAGDVGLTGRRETHQPSSILYLNLLSRIDSEVIIKLPRSNNLPTNAPHVIFIASNVNSVGEG